MVSAVIFQPKMLIQALKIHECPTWKGTISKGKACLPTTIFDKGMCWLSVVLKILPFNPFELIRNHAFFRYLQEDLPHPFQEKLHKKKRYPPTKFANLFLQLSTSKPKWNKKETSLHLILPGILSTWASAFLLVCGRMLHELLLFLVAITFLIVAFATSVCTFLGGCSCGGSHPPKRKNHRKNEAVEKKTGCLGYIGDYTTHLCGYKDPYETNSIMESKMIFFLVAQMMVNKIVITCYPPHLRCFVSFQLHRFANLKSFFTPKKEISFKVNDFWGWWNIIVFSLALFPLAVKERLDLIFVQWRGPAYVEQSFLWTTVFFPDKYKAPKLWF